MKEDVQHPLKNVLTADNLSYDHGDFNVNTTILETK